MIKRKNGVCWLEFEKLQKFPHVRHGVFLIPSQDETIIHSDDFLKQALQVLGLSSLVTPKMTHGDLVLSLDDVMLGAFCDGIMTDKSKTGLRITHADCQAAIFYDTKKNVLANVHCGWRGNVQNIYGNTILQMKQVFDCNPSDLIVCISPSLGPKHAEFINYKTELPEFMWTFQNTSNYFNLWDISKLQLVNAGVLPENIEIASICTFEQSHEFYSYRRNKTKLRNSTIAGLT